MYQYLQTMLDTLNNGIDKADRTGTGTRSRFGVMERYDLKRGFPLLTTKKLHLKSIIGELLWFISGSTNVKTLQAQGIRIWDEWANADGELPEVYGKQWARYEDVRCISVSDWLTGDYIDRGFEIESRDYGVLHNELLDVVNDNDTDGAMELVKRMVNCTENVKVTISRTINQVTDLIEDIRTNPDSRRLIINAWNVQTFREAALPPCHVMYIFNVTGGNLNCMLVQR